MFKDQFVHSFDKHLCMSRCYIDLEDVIHSNV